jgi:hypothetical protein
MARETIYSFGASGRDTLPSQPNTDGTQVGERVNGYGDQYVQPNGLPGLHALAAAGALFEIHEPVRDLTSLAGHAAPAIGDIDATFTKALFFLRNKAGSSDRKRIHLLRLEIRVVTAGASGTYKLWADELDSGATRASGGTALSMVNANPQSSNSLADVLTALGGEVTLAVETSAARKLGFDQMRPSIEVAGDLDVFLYGDATAEPAAAAAAAVRTQIVRRPPVILGPGDSYALGYAAASQNAAGVYKIRALVAYY